VDERACRLANALLGLGLQKGDRIAVLARNCFEWIEIYAAVGKAGFVAVPINSGRFRGSGHCRDSEAKACIVQDDLLDRVASVRAANLIVEDRAGD